MPHGVTFPPAGVIVVRRDLVETELLVVVGADPFGRVDGAFLQCRIDVAAGGATEAENSGADLDAIQAALTHSDKRQTMRYLRDRSSKIATVAELRTRGRKQASDD